MPHSEIAATRESETTLRTREHTAMTSERKTRHGSGRAGKASNVPRPMTLPQRPQTADEVMSLAQERDIRFIRLWFTDILGQLKAFSINATELADAFEGGMGFDGSSITGFNPIEESDMIAMPDPSTFAILPWRPAEQGVARMFCDIQTPGAHPVRGRSAPRAAAGARARQRDGLRPLLRRARARVLLLPRLASRPRCSTRAATST